MPLPSDGPNRRLEFDWLRVIALGLLVVFHSLLGFSSRWHWHVVDPYDSALLDLVLSFELRWRVTLVFVVSGAALMLALRTRSPAQIVRERGLRLLVPLVFAILVIVPPQIYFERLQQGQFAGSYAAFLSHLFNGIYPAGNLSWHHLWFVPYVLVLSVVLLPLFVWMRSPTGRRRLDPLIAAAAHHHLYWLLVLPLIAAEALLRFQGNDSHIFIGDGHGWAVFFLLMTLGGATALWPELLAAIQRGRFVSLALGIAAFAVLDRMWLSVGAGPANLPPFDTTEWCAASAVNMLAWVLTVVGFVTRRFNRPSPLLTYATDAAFPVYILHQTLIVGAVYFLHRTDWPLAVKMPATFLFALVGSLAIYELAIRRSTWLRPLFGLKSLATATSRSTAPSSSGRRPWSAP